MAIYSYVPDADADADADAARLAHCRQILPAGSSLRRMNVTFPASSFQGSSPQLPRLE